MTRTGTSPRGQLVRCSGIVLIALVVVGSGSVKCQFLQPQSHLSRLVQSITSPLVLSSSLTGGDSSDAYEPESSPQAQPDQRQNQQPGRYQPEAGQHYQHFQRQPEFSGFRQAGDQQRGLQQAPSQQRGVPQRYQENSQDDEEAGAAAGRYRHQPANANEQYQMGAYLGPTIDDKEIQGAFNSNDERDEDDGAGYDGPQNGRAPGDGPSQAYAASQPEIANGHPMAGNDQSSYGPGGYGNQQPGAGSDERLRGRGERAQFDDDASADEEDDLPARRRPRFRQSSMSQAASQYHQRQNSLPSQASMMTAANGYSPMGSGPIDLSSLMAAAAAGNNGQAFEVYNGDGSYPGYYPQQQQQGRRNQAASMNSPYGYQQMNGQANQNGAANQQRGDNDDADADADDD